jgi:voltage-dependent potassium channel beta subunit
MQYRRLGEAGIKLSEIGLGGWLTFGNAVDLEQARVVMNAAFDVGINFYDTADVYSGGKCEEAWGEILQHRRRSSYVLASKVFFPADEGPNDRGLSRKHIFEQCNASLRRLKTDYLDIYQCHRFDESVPLEETVRAMDDLLRQGKILYWGFSEWPADKIRQCLELCGDRFDQPRSSQPQYSLLKRQVEAEVLPTCKRAGIGQIVWSPLAQGILTGKYKPGQPFPADSRAKDNRQNHFIKPALQNQDLLAKVQKLAPIAQDYSCSMAQLCLAWVLQHEEITSCIIGATKAKQVQENAEASGMKLSPETVRRMEEIVT